LKVGLLVKGYDNPNGITRFAYALEEADSRFKVVESRKVLFPNGMLSRISRYTVDELTDAMAIPKIEADIIMPLTPVESIPLLIRGNRPPGVFIFDLVHWAPSRDKSSYLFRLYSFLLRRYDVAAYTYSFKVFCISEFVRDQLVQFFGTRPGVGVVRPGLTDSFIESAKETRRRATPHNLASREPLTLLMVPGALTPDEGIEGTVAALGLLRKKFPEKPVLLTLVASRRLENFSSQKSLGDSLGVGLNLSISPTDSQLLDLYASSDVFVHAGNVDWFHYTTLEAMACDVPVVFATDLPSIGFFEGAVSRAKFDNPTSIFEALGPVAIESNERDSFISKGREIVGATSMKKAAEQIYNSIT
jgi:glycosyltransferase involved in cell wall biosynthesis